MNDPRIDDDSERDSEREWQHHLDLMRQKEAAEEIARNEWYADETKRRQWDDAQDIQQEMNKVIDEMRGDYDLQPEDLK